MGFPTRVLRARSLASWLAKAANSRTKHFLSQAPPLQLAAEFPRSAALPGGRACWRVVAGHPHKRRHATTAVEYARPHETPSLAAALAATPPLRTRQACRALVDQFGDHRAACARSGLLARHAPILERAWVRVVREAVAAEGRVVPQQWLAQTAAWCGAR